MHSGQVIHDAVAVSILNTIAGSVLPITVSSSTSIWNATIVCEIEPRRIGRKTDSSRSKRTAFEAAQNVSNERPGYDK